MLDSLPNREIIHQTNLNPIADSKINVTQTRCDYETP